MATEIVPDPVSHISISGVHGRQELEERLASSPSPSPRPAASPAGSLGRLLVAGIVGAAVMFLLRPAAQRLKAGLERTP